MLQELHIRNFAIIDDLHLTFGPGLNILTGETGAGKSIIIDALGLLLGDRSSLEWIRTGTERAEIEATFTLGPNRTADKSVSVNAVLDDSFSQVRHLLEESGLDDLDNPDWVMLSREVRSNGRNICRINGRAVSVQVLGEITSLLVNVHGQGEHLNLLKPKTHIFLLDRYADLLSDRQKVSALVTKLRKIRSELTTLRQDERTIAQRVDMLSYQVEEITQANLRADEEEALITERRRLSNAETLLSLSQSAQTLLSEDGGQDAPSALDLVGEATSRIEKLARIDPEMEPLALEGQGLLEQLADMARTLVDYAQELEFDPRRLLEVEERLELIETLKRKYGDTIGQILAFGEQAQLELMELDNWETKSEALVTEEHALLQEIGKLASDLSEKRQAAGVKLAHEVEKQLAELKMEKARCGVNIQQVERDDGAIHPDGRRLAFDHTGFDRVEFLLSTNPGEPLKPMAKVASGGETARLMLAIKSVLAYADSTPTLIFDEIDQGIGGRVGAVVGQKLWALTGATAKSSSKRSRSKKKSTNGQFGAAQHQVLCITHLPQLAAYGDQHFTVNKQVQNIDGEERTNTVVARINGEPRIQELMQMLGATSDAGRKSVEEMLNEVSRAKLQR